MDRLYFFMAKLSREGYFIDITPTDVSVETPVDRFFIEKEAISAIPYQSNHMAGLLTIHPASETTKRQNDIHG